MSILTIVSTLVTLANSIFSLKEKVSPQYRKEATIRYLNEISKVLHELESELRTDKYPHEKCAYMKYAIDNMIDTLNIYLSSTDVDNLYQLSNQAYQVERLYHGIRNLSEEEREANLGKILEAAGTFKAVADYLQTR